MEFRKLWTVLIGITMLIQKELWANTPLFFGFILGEDFFSMVTKFLSTKIYTNSNNPLDNTKILCVTIKAHLYDHLGYLHGTASISFYMPMEVDLIFVKNHLREFHFLPII
jgi:hypothetical protein